MRPHLHGLSGKRGNIPRAVADQRQRLLGDTCKHQLAVFAVRQNLAGIRIDNLWDKMILIDMQTVLIFTFKRNARSHYFGQAINIMRPDSELFFDCLSHFLCPWLRAEDAGF